LLTLHARVLTLTGDRQPKDPAEAPRASVFMAIPIGTTSRQLGALVRWMYLTVTVTGLLSWWWPSYFSWGALVGGLMVALLLWLCWQTVTVDRTVPGHPVYLVLLVPGAVLTYHLACTGLGAAAHDSGRLSGALNMSMLFHLALLATSVMLSQSLLPRAVSRAGVASVCGAAMIGGGILAGLWADAQPVKFPMSLVGFGGVAVWLAPLWRPDVMSSPQEQGPGPGRLELRILCVAVATTAAGLLAWNCPSAAVFAAVAAGLVLVFASVIFARHSRPMLVTGAVLAVVVGLAAAVWALGLPELLCLGGPILGLGGAVLAAAGGLAAAVWAPGLPELLRLDGPILGLGEEAFGQVIIESRDALRAVTAADSGLYILSGMVGLTAALLTVAGLLVCLATLLLRARRDHPGSQAQTAAWTVAACLSAAALLAPGGLFVPAVVLSVGLTWGLTAGLSGRAARPRPGITVLVSLVAITTLMGVARHDGLVIWAASSVWPGPGGDKLLHAVFGLMLAMTLAWLMGSRNLWWGLAAIVLAALVGGAGEMIQSVTSSGRFVEWDDWIAHAAGSVIAVIPYLLCVGARLGESPDARPPEDLAGEGYLV